MNRNTPKKILFSYLAYYTVFLVFFLIVSLCIFLFLYQQNRKGVDQYNKAFLDQSSQIIEERFALLKRDTIRFITSGVLEESLNTDFTTSAGKLNAFKISKILNSFVYENPYVRHSYLFIQKADMIITESGLYTRKQYYDLKITTSLSFEDWVLKMTDQGIKSSAVQNSLMAEGVFEALFFYHSIPNVPNQKSLATIGIAIDEKILGNMDRGQERILPGELFIFDPLIPLFFPTNHSISQKEVYLIFEEYRNRGKITEINSPSHIIRAVKSSERTQYYLYRFPKAAYYGNLTHYWLIVGLFLIFCLFTGSFFSLYFAGKRGEDMVSIIKSLGIKEIENEKDPMAAINEAARHLVEKTDHISFKNLFLGKIDSMDRKFLNQIDWHGGKNFCALILEIEDVGYAAGDTVGPLIVKNLENDINERSASFFTEEEYIFGLISDKGGIDDLLAYLRALAKRLNDSFGIIISGGLGTWHNGVNEIELTIAEARKASAYKKFSGPGRITGFGEIGSLRNNSIFPLELKKRLIMEIRAGRTDGSILILGQIFEECFPAETNFYEKAESFFYELKNMTLTLVETVQECSQADLNNVRNEIYHIHEIGELREYLDNLIRKICAGIRDRKNNRVKKVGREAIMTFIEKNLTNQDLDLNLAADYFSLSPFYFSACFKEEVNRNFKDYIRTERINLAKKFVMQDLPLTEVARLVGYGNESTLFRNFKKESGITPGFFRQFNQMIDIKQQD